MKKVCMIFLIVIVLFAVFGCTRQELQKPEPAVEGNTVIIKDFAFQPKELAIKVGAGIKWKHDDSVVHTVVSEGLFESKIMNRGDEFEFVFNKPGSYEYRCGIHPSMRGKIIVK